MSAPARLVPQTRPNFAASMMRASAPITKPTPHRGGDAWDDDAPEDAAKKSWQQTANVAAYEDELRSHASNHKSNAGNKQMVSKTSLTAPAISDSDIRADELTSFLDVDRVFKEAMREPVSAEIAKLYNAQKVVYLQSGITDKHIKRIIYYDPYLIPPESDTELQFRDAERWLSLAFKGRGYTGVAFTYNGVYLDHDQDLMQEGAYIKVMLSHRAAARAIRFFMDGDGFSGMRHIAPGLRPIGIWIRKGSRNDYDVRFYVPQLLPHLFAPRLWLDALTKVPDSIKYQTRTDGTQEIQQYWYRIACGAALSRAWDEIANYMCNGQFVIPEIREFATSNQSGSVRNDLLSAGRREKAKTTKAERDEIRKNGWMTREVFAATMSLRGASSSLVNGNFLTAKPSFMLDYISKDRIKSNEAPFRIMKWSGAGGIAEMIRQFNLSKGKLPSGNGNPMSLPFYEVDYLPDYPSVGEIVETAIASANARKQPVQRPAPAAAHSAASSSSSPSPKPEKWAGRSIKNVHEIFKGDMIRGANQLIEQKQRDGAQDMDLVPFIATSCYNMLAIDPKLTSGSTLVYTDKTIIRIRACRKKITDLYLASTQLGRDPLDPESELGRFCNSGDGMSDVLFVLLTRGARVAEPKPRFMELTTPIGTSVNGCYWFINTVCGEEYADKPIPESENETEAEVGARAKANAQIKAVTAFITEFGRRCRQSIESWLWKWQCGENKVPHMVTPGLPVQKLQIFSESQFRTEALNNTAERWSDDDLASINTTRRDIYTVLQTRAAAYRTMGAFTGIFATSTRFPNVEERLHYLESIRQELSRCDIVARYYYLSAMSESLILDIPDVVYAWLYREFNELRTAISNTEHICAEEADVSQGTSGRGKTYFLAEINASLLTLIEGRVYRSQADLSAIVPQREREKFLNSLFEEVRGVFFSLPFDDSASCHRFVAGFYRKLSHERGRTVAMSRDAASSRAYLNFITDVMRPLESHMCAAIKTVVAETTASQTAKDALQIFANSFENGYASLQKDFEKHVAEAANAEPSSASSRSETPNESHRSNQVASPRHSGSRPGSRAQCSTPSTPSSSSMTNNRRTPVQHRDSPQHGRQQQPQRSRQPPQTQRGAGVRNAFAGLNIDSDDE
jgi:hypothetical protein